MEAGAKTENVNATMGSTQSFTSTSPGHYRKSTGDDEHLEGVRLGDQGHVDNQNKNSVSDSHTHQQQQYGGTEPTIITEEAFAALQAELTKREEKLIEYEFEHSKIRGKNRKLRQDATNQRQLLHSYREAYKWQKDLLDCIIRRYVEPYARKASLMREEWETDSIYEVLEQMLNNAMNVGTLQDRVQVLQKDLLSKVDRVQAASDEQLALDFRAIISLVKSLSRTIQLIDVVDPLTTLGEGPLLAGVSNHHRSTRRGMKIWVEAWIWSVLMRMVFHNPYAIFGKHCDVLNKIWQDLFHENHVDGWPSPSALCETWRYTTMERMTSLVDCEIITKGETKGTNTMHHANVLQAREAAMNEIRNGLMVMSASSTFTQVQNIINKAFALAMKMSLQRYRLQITYPKAGGLFKEEEMTAVQDHDGDDKNESVVAFVVNPALTKWGDTHGNHFDHRYDIVPALVQLESVSREKSMEQTFVGLGELGL